MVGRIRAERSGMAIESPLFRWGGGTTQARLLLTAFALLNLTVASQVSRI